MIIGLCNSIFPTKTENHTNPAAGNMVYNEILKREIPKGWEVKTLKSLCKFSNGINYDKTIQGNKQYRIVNVRNISSSSILINSQTLDVISLPAKQADNYLIEEDCILIARSGTPGATRIINKTDNCIYCGFIIKCLPNNTDQRLYLTFILKRYEGTSLTQTGGSILKNVSQETLKTIHICIPPKNIIESFNDVTMSMITIIQGNMEQSNALIKQRNELLPLLMNGQVNFDLSAD